jgi:DUF4097 and DUF4098 domain-containing protein YvlB
MVAQQKDRIMHRLNTYITAGLLVAGIAADADAQQRARDDDDRYTSRLDTTFAFGPRGSGEISVPGGDIIVQVWNQQQVRVRAATERGMVRLETSGGFFSLGLRGQHNRSTDARFEVTVPVGTRIKANTQTGDISIQGTKAEAEAGTMSGDVQIEDVSDRLAVSVLSGDVRLSRITGDIRVNAISGEVALDGGSGDAEIVSVSGDVDIRGFTSRRVRAASTSGDILYDGTIDPSGRYDLKSHSGEVDLIVPTNASAQVTVATFSGGIESDFPITLNPGEHGLGLTSTKRFTFNIGKGEARIVAESFSGDVTIRQRGRTRDR